jgi:hypothetical protein
MQLLAPEVSELQTSVYQFGPLAAVEILYPHLETEIKNLAASPIIRTDKPKENEMGITCSTYDSNEKCIQNCILKPERNRAGEYGLEMGQWLAIINIVKNL